MVPKRSSGAPALRQSPVSRPSTLVPPEKESTNLGGDINTNINDIPNTADCDPVIDSILAHTNNDKEEFMEKIKDIDKGMKSFELSKIAVTKSNTETITPPPNGPNLDPTIATSKPIRWTWVARPSTSQEKPRAIKKLGKCSNPFLAKENSIQKHKALEEQLNYDCDYPMVVSNIQPRREL